MEAAATVAVAQAAAPIGALLPVVRRPSPELLREVAAASATLVEVVRLRLELTAALREVEASRARLVQAGYEERRRLERDLHDGAQQRLVSLGMALRLAQRHLDDGTVDDERPDRPGRRRAGHRRRRAAPDRARPAPEQPRRRAARSAGRADAARPDPGRLHVQPEPLPDDVATTVYYVTSEAIANAVKHADATRIDVRIARCDGRLEVRISDDGRGGASRPPAPGLAGLSDRVHAASAARWRSTATTGRGTVVEAVVPCGS